MAKGLNPIGLASFMKWYEENQDRFWQGILLLAVLLNIYALTTSDLGLDTHQKMAYVEVEGGYALDWGDVRLENPNASNPDDASIVSNPPLTAGYSSEAVLFSLIAISIIGYIVGMRKEFIALILIHPALIFATGRGYDEPIIALLMAFVILLMTLSENSKNSWVIKMLIGLPILGILVIKNTIPEDSLLIPTLILILAMGVSCCIPDSFFQPKKMLLEGFGLGIVLVLILGFIGKGTPTIIFDEPGRFLYALPFAIIDVILIYGFIGMVIWPFFKQTWENMTSSKDRLVGELALIIGGFTGLITMYVAVLWAYEYILCNSDWPWHMFIMGNNGRYITLLAVPIYFLIMRVNDEIDWKNVKVFIGVMLILPLSIAASIHGQTMWTDDAAESMEIEPDEHFLFVSDATLGMHWLYTFHEPLNAEEENITGHWRSDEAKWQDDLNDELSHVNWIVLAPEITEVPSGWMLHESGDADFLNGGGEWRVLKRV